MNSLLKNSSLNFLSQILTFILNFLLSVIFARYLGSALMGEYSFIIQLVTTIALIFTLGLPTALTKYISNFNEKNQPNIVIQLLSKSLILEILISLIVTFSALFLLPNLISTDQNLYLIALLTLPFLIVNNILRSALQGLQKYDSILKINFIISIINFGLSILLVLLNRNLPEILLLNFIIQGLTIFLSFRYLKGYIKFQTPKIENSTFNEIKKYTLTTSLIVLLDLILIERSEVFFLKAYSSIEEVAFYSISFALVYKLMGLIPGSITGVMMPAISGLHGLEDREKIKFTYFNTTRYLVFITAPIVAIGIGIVDLFINLFYGSDYLKMIPVAQILLISGGLTAIAASASAVLYGINKQSVILKMGIAMVIINLTLDFLLIPSYGSIGASIANATAQISAVVLGTIYIIKVTKLKFPFADSFKVVSASLLSLATILVLKQLINLPLVIEMIILTFLSSTLYFYNLWLLKFFNTHDKAVLNKVTNKMLSLSPRGRGPGRGGA